MTLAEFERRLTAIAPKDVAGRPFLCHGSRIGCDVFLVGINPGTDTPLWPHWSQEGRCDKDAWLRTTLPGTGGRSRSGRGSSGYASLRRERMLETNVFHVPTPREAVTTAGLCVVAIVLLTAQSDRNTKQEH